MVKLLKASQIIKEGYIVLVNYGISKGHVQGGIRPALVVSNNIGNRYSPLVNYHEPKAVVVFG